MHTTGKKCNVCKAELEAPVYDSKSAQSLTSLCELHPGSTQVWFCNSCGHILGNALEETDEYYATQYKILLEHEEEDQIYEVIDGEITYRVDHQIKVLNEKLSFKPGMKVLDYGCAKAGMSKRLKNEHPDLGFHFFDVSEMYIDYWEKITPRENHAVFETPSEWARRFDVITSYFSLEHIPDPAKSAQHIASLLKDDGVFYAIVPDTFGNKADFVVVDHVNHFTHSSLVHLLQEAGFSVVKVDSVSHRGALVVQARKIGESTPAESVSSIRHKVDELADFWSRAAAYIQDTQAQGNGPFAIYGSGFYGAFIYSHLDEGSEVTCFLDQSPYQQGKKLFGVPIVPPASLIGEVSTVFVGLNPIIAREVMASQPDLNRPELNLVFLDLPA